MITYCPTCGDYLFNGQHQGNVERWCHELNETKIQDETEVPASASSVTETKIRKRGRPRRETITPWAAAGMSRATWYRRREVKNG